MLFCEQFFTVKLMKHLLLYTLLFLFSNLGFAQKVVDPKIPDSEKRRVIRAKKLLNNFKIYEGERILKDLVKEHPNDAYYHEALVQVQRQVLRDIKKAYILEGIPTSKTANIEQDTTDGFETNDTLQYISKKPATLSDFGLNRDNEPSNKKSSKIEKDFSSQTPFDIEEENDTSSNKSDLLENEPNGDSKELKRAFKDLRGEAETLESLAIIPYETYQYDFLQNCRKATRQLNIVDSASYYLRTFLIDTINTDLFAPDEALDLYHEALVEFHARNVPLATSLLQKTIEIYPPFYNAHIYLGNCYFLLNNDTAAIKEFQTATYINPNLPDAFEKLALYNYSVGNYTEAASHIIEAIMVYPEHQFFAFLKRAVNKSGTQFDNQWISREVFPISTIYNFEEIVAEKKTPWWHYQETKADVFNKYDSLGIRKPNEKSIEKYAEIYSWKKMLNKADKEYFPFARAMQKMGYLECYVFITLFHHDIYSQFKDYVEKNPEKVKEYFYILINWNDKKFDKIREKFGMKKETE